MLEPALAFEGQTIYQGDARAVLAALPPASVHAVVTSPPYWRLRDYDDPNQIGQEHTVDEYVSNLVDVFDGVRRVLRPDGLLWLNVDDSYVNKRLALAPQRLAIALDAVGWILRCDPIWHKPSTMPESAKDRPGRDHEYLFQLASRADGYFFDWFAVREPAVSLDPDHPSFRPNSERIASAGRRNFEGKHTSARSYGDFRLLRSTWFFTPDRYEGAHFAPMPRALVERCIRAGTSEAGVCSVCGAPRIRHVETRSFKRTELPPEHPAWRPETYVGKYDDIYRENPGQAFSESEHLGWNPSCACDAPSVPAVVLDPFAGAGTTALVARKLRRRSIGVELNPAYIDLIGARLEEPETVARAAPDDEHVQLILG